MTEFVKELPEIGSRLTFAGVGPELERESRPVLQISSDDDQAQKPLQAKGVEGAQAPTVQNDPYRTEKPDLQPPWCDTHSTGVTPHGLDCYDRPR